jgi:hypothetical protein
VAWLSRAQLVARTTGTAGDIYHSFLSFTHNLRHHLSSSGQVDGFFHLTNPRTQFSMFGRGTG